MRHPLDTTDTAGPDEREALLPDFEASSPDIGTPAVNRTALRTVFAIGVLMFMLEISSAITIAPRVQIIEGIVCEVHELTLGPSMPSNHSHLEVDKCKTEAIQTEVALIIGWQNTFEMIPGEVSRAHFDRASS